MPYDGNGNFVRAHNWVADAANAIDINAVEMDQEDNGIAAALSNAVTRDGQGKMAVDFLPNADNTLNLGSGAKRWASLNGVPISSIVPTQAMVGGLLYPQTAGEIAAGVTPTNFIYAPHVPLRYGAVGDGVTDDHVAVQNAFNVAGKSGGTVYFPASYTFFCNADITVPVAVATASPVPSAQGSGWATIAVIFGSGATFGFIILGTGATTGGTQGSTYNYAGMFEDMAIQLNGTVKDAFYINSVNQPKIKNCWIRGSGTNGCAAYFLNCLLPVFEDCLVTGCGSTTQYSVEFDTCTTPQWRGSRISGGNTTKGGLAIDRCTNTVIDGCSSESSGIPIVISGKAEAVLANATITLRGLELENPGNGNPYIDIGAGLSGTALVVDVLLDRWFGSPSGTTTLPFGVRMQNITGFEARGGHFTLAAGTSAFELVGTNVTGVIIRAHRNLKSLGVPWMRYNGTQVKSWGPEIDCGPLGLVQNGGGPMCQHRGVMALFATGISLSGTSPSILSTSSMGGFYDVVQVSNGGATTMTLLDGEPGMKIGLYFANGNTTLSTGAGLGQFNLKSGQTNPVPAGSLLNFVNDGQNGVGGNRWTQV